MDTDTIEITEINTETKKETKRDNEKWLVLQNDDHNSFEHVIECLVLYCNKTVEEGIEIATTVHTKGACDVLSGSEKSLRPIYETLLEKGLTVKID